MILLHVLPQSFRIVDVLLCVNPKLEKGPVAGWSCCKANDDTKCTSRTRESLEVITVPASFASSESSK